MKKVQIYHQPKIGDFFESSETGNIYQLIDVGIRSIGLLNSDTGRLFSVTEVNDVDNISKEEFRIISWDVLQYLGKFRC